MMATFKEKVRAYLKDQNSDNWDLARWRREEQNFHKLAAFYGIIVSFLFLYHVVFPLYNLLPGAVLILLLAIWISGLAFVYCPLKIKRLEEKEGA
jgi:hypothetical protein